MFSNRHVCVLLVSLLVSQSALAAESDSAVPRKPLFPARHIERIDSIHKKLEASVADDERERLLKSMSSALQAPVLFGWGDRDFKRQLREIEKEDPRQAVLFKTSYCHKRLIEELGAERMERLTSTMWQLAKDENPSIRFSTYEVLLERLYVAEAEDVLECMLDSPSGYDRGTAAYYLGERYNERAIPVLREEYLTDDPSRSFFAERILLQMGHRDGAPAIRSAVVSPGNKQVAAVECLAEHGNEEDFRFLFESLASGKLSDEAALVCFSILCEQADKLTRPEKDRLLAYWETHSPVFSEDADKGLQSLAKTGVRRYIVNLRTLGGEKASDLIAEFLFHPEPTVVDRAVADLGHLRDHRYVGLVAPFLDSPEERQAQSAVLSMERMLAPEGKRVRLREIQERYGPLEKQVAHWKKWWSEHSHEYPVPEKFESRVDELP